MARVDSEAWAEDEETPTALIAKNFYVYLVTLMASKDGDDYKVPKTYAEAMRRPDLWRLAMEEELKMMEDRGVFELVQESQVSRDKNIVSCRCYANKFDAEGTVTQRKARLVTKGYSQVAGEDFDETYAAVVRLESLRMSMAVAAQEGLRLCLLE